MSLLKEIIAEATAKTVDVPRLLRLCMVLASRLQFDPMLIWVREELEGYPPEAELPAYRVLRVRNKGQFIGHLEGILDLPLSLLPERMQPHYEQAMIRDGIAEYLHLLDGVSGRDGNLGAMQLTWPPEVALKYASKYVNYGQCIKAWSEVSAAEVAGMLDKIKTKVLAFALQLEAEAPNAGEIESPAASIEERRVSQIFNTTINGAVQNYAAGATNISQVAVGGSVRAGDLDSLLTTLRSAGVAEADLEDLQGALEEDGRSAASGMGAAVKGWLGGLAAKAALGAASIGGDVVSGVVAQAIVAYLGIFDG
ncbi:MAG: hypothetical protein JSR42_01040 [Proteobacteria bacterium]|nr:hypothetical protein [Pseudomonadota bacterium]MBS0554480.1 hypothetical protein [Pseudomonadota bacterium]